MSPQALETLAMVLAVAGLGCFLWPIVGRLRAGDEAADTPRGLRSRVWWAGLILTVLALAVQRQAGG